MESSVPYFAGSFVGPNKTWEVTDELIFATMTRVLRNDYTQPGVALLDGGTTGESRTFREFLSKFVHAMDTKFQQQHNKKLWITSAVHLNQTISTPAHVDIGPAESVLVLGYEPTPVPSRFRVVDYIRYAESIGQPVHAFLREFLSKPQESSSMFDGFKTELSDFRHDRFQIIVVNNSTISLESCQRTKMGMLGVMHQVTVDDQDLEGKVRMINSMLLGVSAMDALSVYGEEDLQKFIEGESYSYGN